MIKVLMVGSAPQTMAELIHYLKRQPDLSFTEAQTGADALDQAGAGAFDLVIADETLADMSGLAFVRKLIGVDPLTNSALVSSLAEDDFHEASEGLGVLARLPVNPGIDAGQALLERLYRVLDSGLARK